MPAGTPVFSVQGGPGLGSIPDSVFLLMRLWGEITQVVGCLTSMWEMWLEFPALRFNLVRMTTALEQLKQFEQQNIYFGFHVSIFCVLAQSMKYNSKCIINYMIIKCIHKWRKNFFPCRITNNRHKNKKKKS